MTGYSSNERNSEILRRFEAGESIRIIARDFGITRQRVGQIIKVSGVATARRRSTEKRQQIAAAIAAGNLSIREAARRFGYSDNGIANITREYGVEPRRDVRPGIKSPRGGGEVIVCPTPREAAVTNYGKASAAAIAAAHGVTRNSIIGHWFRARLAGELA